MNKGPIVQKLAKLLMLYQNAASTRGEKDVAIIKIKNLCEQHKLKIDGNTVIDLEAVKKVETQKTAPISPVVKQTILGDPSAYNRYVYYNGQKYYGRVPKHIYEKDNEIRKRKF